jgi:hypothetical protein
VPREDLDWAIREWRSPRRRREYKLYRDYYDGRHRMAFSEARFKLIFNGVFEAIRDNLCPAVVDSLADRLRVTGFTSNVTRKTVVDRVLRRQRVTDPLAQQAWGIWRRNEMGQRASEVHRDALITGNGYAIVWPDANGLAAIWPRKPEEMVVEYSEEVPGQLARAARLWRGLDGHLRVNLFYPTHTERYVSARARAWSGARADAFDPVSDGPEVKNPYGVVPVLHFPNKAMFADGVSHLVDVVPLQDALNKSLCDEIVASEFAAYPQRWATGLELELDETGKPISPPFRPGVNRIFAAEDERTKFGEFAAADIAKFIEVQENKRAEIARVSGTPLHYLFITRGDYPSGEAMKSAEARFSTGLEDRQESWGNRWEAGLTLALRIEEARLPKAFELASLWRSATPRSEEEQARTIALKRKVGVTRRQALKEFGYDDEAIAEMLEEEPDAFNPDDPELGADEPEEPAAA